MGAFVQVSAGPVGSGAANAGYITRESSEGEEGILFYQAPDDVADAETWQETRVRLRSWAEQTCEEEKARHGNRAGQARTHYRAIISYEEDVEIENEEALEDAERFLEEEFPKSRAVAVVHRDTDQTHVHIWMSARQVDDSKVHIDRQQTEEMHETMDRIYEERTQRKSRNAEKVRETREFKRSLSQIKERGASEEELKEWAQKHRPDRANPPSPETYRQREERLAGQQLAEQTEKRAEQAQVRQVEKADDLISKAEKRIQETNEQRLRLRQERFGRAKSSSSGRDKAPEQGEREADRGGEDEHERGSERTGPRGRGGGSRRKEADEPSREPGERGRKQDQQGEQQAGISSSSLNRSGDVDRGASGERRSVDTGGGGSSEMGDDSSLEHRGDSADGERRGGSDKLGAERVREQVRDALEEGTTSQKVKAAYAFYDLDKEDRETLWRSFSVDEREVVLRGIYAGRRAQAGTQEAYKQLSPDQQAVVTQLHKASHGLEGASKRVKAAAEVMSEMTEEQRDQIRNALPEKDRGPFEKALEKVRNQESQEKSQDRGRGGQSRGRSRGGWGRGR